MIEMDKDREKKLEEYITIKKHIKACFNMKKFVEIMKESIDNSDHFDFSSERSKKFININRPIFILKTNMVDGKNTKDMDIKELDILMDNITETVRKEIIDPISDTMMDFLCDPEKYHELVEIDKDLVNLCITNIYKVRIDKIKGLVQLEYFDF